MLNLVSKEDKLRNRTYQLCVSGGIALLFAANYIINKYINGDLFTLVIWGLFLLLVYIKDIKFLLKYSYILLMQCSNILGIYICENSTLWLTELHRFSEPFGSLFIATVSHWIFFLTLWWIELYLADVFPISEYCKKTYYKKFLNYIGLFILCIALVALAHSASNPAFTLGIDRFRYSEMFLQGFWKYPDKILGLTIPLIGMLYILGHRKISISVLIIYSLYLFCIGNKFGGFLNLFFLSVPIVYAVKSSDEVLKKTFAMGIVVSILMVGTVFFHNYLTYGLSMEKNLIYLEQRFAQQGQLWWAQYGKENGAGCKIDELGDETKTYFVLEKQPKEEWNHGIYKVMRNVTPQNIYDSKIASGSRYASATLASIYYYFKEIGLMVGNVALAFLFWIVTNCYYRDFISGDVVGAIIMSKYFIWMHMVATQADFDIIFSFKALFGLVVYIVFKFIMSNLEKRRSNFEVA